MTEVQLFSILKINKTVYKIVLHRHQRPAGIKLTPIVDLCWKNNKAFVREMSSVHPPLPSIIINVQYTCVRHISKTKLLRVFYIYIYIEFYWIGYPIPRRVYLRIGASHWHSNWLNKRAQWRNNCIDAVYILYILMRVLGKRSICRQRRFGCRTIHDVQCSSELNWFSRYKKKKIRF